MNGSSMAMARSAIDGDDRAVEPALASARVCIAGAHCCTQRRERSCWTAVMTRMITVITTEIEAA